MADVSVTGSIVRQQWPHRRGRADFLLREQVVIAMPRSSRSSLMNLFPAAPNVEQYSAVGSIEEARRRLTQAVRDAEGIGLLIGPPGTGKSMLCCLLAESLREDFDVVLLADTRMTTRRTLLQNIMFHMDLPYQGLSEGELRLALMDRLTRGAVAAGKQALVLIIDEAQSLPARLLEEVRMINNVVRDGTPRVRTVLAGGVELDDRFAQPQLESLSQRVAARCYLHPLSGEDTARYVRDALMRAGADPHVMISDEAVAAVHHACAGVPRLINQMMRQALQVAPGANIDGHTIQQAWAGLQQLASPLIDVRPLRVGPAASPHPAANVADPHLDIVEFGGLSDGDSSTSSFEVGMGTTDRPETNKDESLWLDETSPEIAAELDRVTASLEQLAGDVVDSSAADVWDEQCLPTTVQTSADRPDCQYVLPEGDVAADLCSLYTDVAPRPATECLLWQDEFQAGDALRQEAACEGRPWADEQPAVNAADALPVVQQDRDDLPMKASPGAMGSPAAFFGDGFDQEEPIPQPLQVFAPRPTAVAAAGEDSPCDPETLLHREIVRIAAEASQVEFADELPAAPQRSTLPLQRLRSDRRAVPDSSDIQLSDDSDLLVVEDGVELSAYGELASVTADGPADGNEIDFKTLFSRLRHG